MAQSLSNLKRPVLVLSASDTFNSRTLKHVAAGTQGWYVNLSSVSVAGRSKAVSDEVEKVLRPSVTLSLASIPNDFHEVVREETQIGNGKVVLISAKVRKPVRTGTMALRFSSFQKVQHQEVTFDYKMLTDSRGIVRTAWAASKLRELLKMPGDHDEDYLQLGKQYHLITPRTSLIVLETWQDYQQYGIAMPPDVQQEYDRQFRQPAKSPRTPASGTDSIFGRVTDEQGNPLPGVSVRLHSDQSLERQTTSGPTGAFLFAGIPPGVYLVTSSLEGFTSANHGNIRVADRSALELKVTLRLGLAEEFVVTAEPTVVDTKKTATESTFNREAPDRVPGARDPWVVFEETPRVDNDRLNVAGSESGQQTRFWPKGATSGANTWNYDGLNAPGATETDPTPTFYDFDSFEVLAGKPAEAAENKQLLEQIIAEIATPGTSVEQKCRRYIAGRMHLLKTKAYYLRASKLFEAHPVLARRVLSDMIEFGEPDPGSLRATARLLALQDKFDLAEALLSKASRIAPAESQTWRDLGLLLAKMGRRKEAEESLRRVLAGQADQQFSGIIQITTEELERLVRMPVTVKGIDLEADSAFDLKIVLSWDTNYTDVDLHVLEPSGEEVYYDHLNGNSGSMLSEDNTSGYGPEVYKIARALGGDYEIYATYYQADNTSTAQSTTATISVYQRDRKGTVVRADYPIVLSTRGEKQNIVRVSIQ